MRDVQIQKSEFRSQEREGQARSAATTNLSEFQPSQVRFDSNRSNPESRDPSPESRTFTLFNPRLEDLAAMTERDFKRLFRDSPIKRAKYRGWLRNLCVAMGNSGDACFIPRLRDLSAYPDPVVREHAVWALRRLETRQAASNSAP